MKTIWLASWYPNKIFPFNGDFIKRHAAAVSLYEDVHVITVQRDETGSVTRSTLKEEFSNGKLKETIVYYYCPKHRFSFYDKWRNERRYQRAFIKTIHETIKKEGKPHLVHVHVGMKAGVFALWMKRNYGTPYVISEHWSGFLKEADKKFNDLPFYLRNSWNKIMTHCTGVSAVSMHLLNGVAKHFPNVSLARIANVVDTSIFYPAPVMNDIRFIHISGLQPLKNPGDILRAFAIVVQTEQSAKLDVFGSKNEEIIKLATDFGLQNAISFHEEIPQQELAMHMNKSTGLILYSTFETFGCVIIEANACGLPVIVSDIPTFHETVTEGENGYFVPLHSPEKLAQRMLELIKNRSSFNSNAIATKTGSKYGYAVVGEQFSNWYREMLKQT
ncbi:MAG TPA: glycosyltransferase [Chitinophagaceae bacterium]|nr:glycosyltransferase [Chitinophagaceae bacterium]